MLREMDAQSSNAQDLALKLGYTFREPALLERALVHSSYLNEDPEFTLGSNERLEFLGDAVIALAVATELSRRFPDATEGDLTQARSHLVRGTSLARISRSLGLGGHLRMGRGEESAGGRERESNLEAALEAVIGAVYLDAGFESAQDLVLRLLEEPIDALMQNGVPANYKGRLQELTQSRGLGQPRYCLLAANGPENAPIFDVRVEVNGKTVGHGTGRRKVDAEQAAAREALRSLENARPSG
jgi:ribonuclease-3